MQPQFAIVGPLVAASATNIRTAATAVAGTLVLDGSTVSGGVATLDAYRRVLITTTSNTDSGKTLVLTGTTFNGQPATETITFANAGTYPSVLDYKTLTSAVLSADSVGNISLGTNGTAGSPWVKFDHYLDGRVAIQATVSGTVSYTIQQTLDDPSNVGNPVVSGIPSAMAWVSSSDPAVVAATTTQQSNYAYAPVFARIFLVSNTNPGFVTGTFIQNGSQ